MDNSVPLIRTSLLSAFPALVKDLGGPLEEILLEAGLNLEQIEQPTLLIPFDRQIRLLQIAAQRCRQESFGLDLAARQDVAIFGALSILVGQASTVHKGLELFGRYIHYSVQAVELSMRVEGELVFFSVDSPFAAALESHQFWDHAVALMYTVTRMVCGQNWAPRSVFLSRPEPQAADRYSRYFRCPVAFDSNFSGLVFQRQTLDRPVSGSIDAVPGQLQAYLRNNYQGDFLEQVRRVIGLLLVTQTCTTTTVAQCLGCGRRSLQRRLDAEGTSFQRQLDALRAELAIRYLEEPQFSLLDISELLGFANAAAFTRSFKRWFGIPPSKWRTRGFGQATGANR